MRETVYQALYVKGRGKLRRELAARCAPDGPGVSRTAAAPPAGRAGIVNPSVMIS